MGAACPDAAGAPPDPVLTHVTISFAESFTESDEPSDQKVTNISFFLFLFTVMLQ